MQFLVTSVPVDLADFEFQVLQGRVCAIREPLSPINIHAGRTCGVNQPLLSLCATGGPVAAEAGPTVGS
jgi:hypothetical protein